MPAGTASGYAFICTHGGEAIGKAETQSPRRDAPTAGSTETPSAQGARDLHAGMSVDGSFNHSGSRH